MDHQRNRKVNDVWQAGGAYEDFMGRWSRLVAAKFLRWLAAPPGHTWLDVGCGTGMLSRAVLESADPQHVRGVDPSQGFISFAQKYIPDPRAVFEVGSAESLSFEPNVFDMVVSGLALNFFRGADIALAEMKRVARSGGLIAAYVWDYGGKMEFLRHFWDAAIALDPVAVALDEGKRFPICNPGKLRELFGACGLSRVEVRSIDVQTGFADFEDYWVPFLSGQGPAPAYVASLSEMQRASLRERLRTGLPISLQGTINLIARAWAVKGYL